MEERRPLTIEIVITTLLVAGMCCASCVLISPFWLYPPPTSPEVAVVPAEAASPGPTPATVLTPTAAPTPVQRQNSRGPNLLFGLFFGLFDTIERNFSVDCILPIWIVCAIIAMVVFYSKGYDFGTSFVFGLFGPFAMLYSFFIPHRPEPLPVRDSVESQPVTDTKGYGERIQDILGPMARGGMRLEWETVTEARLHKSKITQVQKELRLLRKEIAQDKKAVTSAYTTGRARVGKGFGSELMAGIFGRRRMGRANVLARDNLRQRQLEETARHDNAIRAIDNAMLDLDKVKLQLDQWITANS